MTLKVTQGHWKWHYSISLTQIACYQQSSVTCQFQWSWEFNSFTTYLTFHDFNKSFVCARAVSIIGFTLSISCMKISDLIYALFSRTACRNWCPENRHRWKIPIKKIKMYTEIQLLPVNPGRQLQLKPFTWSWHVPPCWHGLLAHSFNSASQLMPVTQTEYW